MKTNYKAKEIYTTCEQRIQGKIDYLKEINEESENETTNMMINILQDILDMYKSDKERQERQNQYTSNRINYT